MLNVAIGLVKEANLETWFISEMLLGGSHSFLAERLLNAPSASYLYVSCMFLLIVICDLLGGRAHGRSGYLILLMQLFVIIFCVIVTY